MREPFKPIRISVHDQARDYLLGKIRAGEFSPGKALPPERELASTLGVSRHSLRQALSALETMGLVESRHGAGVFLTERTPHQAIERLSEILFDVNQSPWQVAEARMLIEPGIAELAAQRASESEIVELRLAADAFNAVDGDSQADDVGNSFHITLAAITGNRVLEGLMRSLISGPRNRSRLTALDPSAHIGWNNAHEEILDAIASRDPSRARAVMQEHIEKVLLLTKQIGDETEITSDGNQATAR